MNNHANTECVGCSMELLEVADHLVKFGAILGIVLGLISTFFWAYVILLGLGLPVFAVNFYELFMLVVSLIALLLSYFVMSRFSQQIDADPSRWALYLVGLGIIIAIGSWGVAGLLIVVGAILILIDETS